MGLVQRISSFPVLLIFSRGDNRKKRVTTATKAALRILPQKCPILPPSPPACDSHFLQSGGVYDKKWLFLNVTTFRRSSFASRGRLCKFNWKGRDDRIERKN